MEREDECSTVDSVTSSNYVMNPWYLKPLIRKSTGDVYFEGTKGKKCHSNRKQSSVVCVAPPQSCKVPQFWSTEKVNEIMPIKPLSQEELVELHTEEIQFLSLEDLQVYRKRFPRKIPSPANIWTSSDFPSMKIGTESGSKDCKYVHHKWGSSKLKTNGNQSIPSRCLVSTYCQTEVSSFPEGGIGIFQKSSSFRNTPHPKSLTSNAEASDVSEYKKIISELSRFLLIFMVKSLNRGTSGGNDPSDKSSGNGDGDVLTAFDKEKIKCILYSEIRHFSTLPSGNSFERRLDRITSSFRVLLDKYPILRENPGFSCVNLEETLWSNK